jgi:subtilisin family serine protease
VVASTIVTENVCQGRHHFEVVNPPLPAFMRLSAESAADINPLSRHVFPVEFDTTGLAAGLYQGTVTVRCLTCRTERGCLKDRDVLHIFMTVEPEDAKNFVPGRVLVMMPYDSAEGASATAKKLGAAYGLKVEEITQLKSLKAALIVFSLPEGGDVLKKVAELAPHVLLAQPDFLYATSNPPLGKASASAGLQYGPRLIGSDRLHDSVTGKGVKIALVDTGLDAAHPALAGKIGEEADMTGKGFTPDVHATLLAGIMVSEPGKKNNGIAGVAPGAEILAVKACQPQTAKAVAAQCWSLTLDKGLDFAIEKHAGVINMSLGGPAGVEDKLLKRMVDEAVNRGILVVAAAGNDGPKAKAGLPAALPNVIAVTAVDANEQLYPHATRGAFVDLAAPGVEIVSTSPGGKVSVSSGTSMATAFVSATAALLLQLQPRLSPQALRALLERTAKDLGPPGKDPEFGNGLVNACRAVAALKHDGKLCK